MSRYLKRIILFLVIAIASYGFTIYATPYVILLVVKIGAKSTLNEPVYADIMTDKDRFVTMPNPDFLYVACGYSVLKTPVRITGNMPEDSYCSLALYSANTLNFFIRNDKQAKDKKVDVLLVRKGEGSKYTDSYEEVVEAPFPFGVMLVRILIENPDDLSYIREIQKSFVVTPI